MGLGMQANSGSLRRQENRFFHTASRRSAAVHAHLDFGPLELLRV